MSLIAALIFIVPIISLTVFGLLIDKAPEYRELNDGTFIKVD